MILHQSSLYLAVMTKKLDELSLVELSELLLSTNDQFLLALQNHRPIEVLQHLRDCLKEIHAEIKKREGLKERG